ncbi:hypothetical protein ACLOJK_014709 [Asimina triloba]
MVRAGHLPVHGMGFQPKDFSRGRLGTDRWWTLMVDRRNRTLDLGRWVLAVGFRNPQLEGDADDTVDRYLGSLDLGDRWPDLHACLVNDCTLLTISQMIGDAWPPLICSRHAHYHG